MDKKDNKKSVTRKVKNVRATGKKSIKSDVQGSYTGVPDDPYEPYERPIQDVDDL